MTAGDTLGRRGDAALEKAFDLFREIHRDSGSKTLATHAAALGIPDSTARRMAAAMARKGLVASVGPGRYVSPFSGRTDIRASLAAAAARPIRQLAAKLHKTIHLGVFEGAMVTYVLKEQGGAAAIFTRPDNQLEAYCSALGKLLLAHQPTAEQEHYLRDGPFIALTANTITAPDALRAEFGAIAARGYAVDDGEVAEGLFCVAVPVRGLGGMVIAALSCSQMSSPLTAGQVQALRTDLEACANSIAIRQAPMLI